MANQFGPWATLIDIGGSPQLSAFWQRRMTMLLLVSQTSSVLSRRNVLWLGVAVLLMLALPTFRPAPLAAEENEPPKPAVKASANSPTPEKAKSYLSFGLYSTKQHDADAASGFLWLPVYINSGLCYEQTRKDLNITGVQEKKLREISANALKQSQELHREMRKLAERLTPQQRTAKRREFQTRLAQQARAIREQIDQLLTPEQLTAVRSEAIGAGGFGLLVSNPKLREKIGLSEGQTKELFTHIYEDRKAREQSVQREKVVKETDEKSLAVISPQQWEQIEQIIAKGDVGGIAGATLYPGPEWSVLSNPRTAKQLALSTEQQATLSEIEAQAQTRAQQLSKLFGGINDSLLPQQDRQAKITEVNRKLSSMRKEDQEQIERVLTSEQSAKLRKLVTRQEFLSVLLSPTFVADESRGTYSAPTTGILDRIHATKEQKDELRRLHDERDRMVRQMNHEAAEAAMKVLTPQQQEKVIDELDRQVFSAGDEAPVTPMTNGKTVTKVGVGTMTITQGATKKVGPNATDIIGAPPAATKPAIKRE